MIISKQKELDEIVGIVKERDIFIIGCGKCASKLHVGGEIEVNGMGKKLTAAKKNVTGWTVLSSACSIGSWKDVLDANPGIEKSGAILVMSCGAGVSVISRFADISVYPALDTESLGGICLDETVEAQCGMCGNCTIWMYGGICPIVQCAKGLLNGPCGGASEGKCEVDERNCAWDLIFKNLAKQGGLEKLKVIHKPRDYGIKSGRQRT